MSEKRVLETIEIESGFEVDCILPEFYSIEEFKQTIKNELFKVYDTIDVIKKDLIIIEVIIDVEPIIYFFTKYTVKERYLGDKGNFFRFKAGIAKENIIGSLRKKEVQGNIVKKVCEELSLTPKQLAEEIGIKEQSLRNMNSNGRITEQVEKSINLLIKNHNLKTELKNYHILKEALKNLTKEV
ncbi:hypothetical protein [Arcobacter sp.]|uniref:hypothetical protein n=1 Tax=unclassified Arcobacter TaxID=2593671 RepID=UPI003AFFB00A